MPNLTETNNKIFSIPPGKRKTEFSKYFPYQTESDFKKKIDALMAKYLEEKGSFDFDADAYSRAVEETVREYTSNKDTLIRTYKQYTEFLEREYDLKIEIAYPPIPISNTFERLMFIAKFLQDKEKTVDDLYDVLWVSQRTIESDLAKLRGTDDDPLQVCGQEFVIDEMDRSLGSFSFGSTAHPLFLTCNLTQIIATLEGLKEMAEKPEYAGYAMPMARNIWAQLSEYAKKRIFFVSENLIYGDTEWYRSLEGAESGRAYMTEMECSRMGDDALMFCLKNSEKRKCYIEYKDDNGTEFISDATVVSMHEDDWTIEVDGKKRVLKHNKIVKSSFHKENMF